ncbi:hypothetical protein [Candidatus Hecatella orcuttiae]|jgi:uncharacterized membrane protein|uniref:hypothetical protein n=1 Tax=Candidatus Hecatella orcuttiae TaxID=1935119 RepID=UPI002867D2C6|nr:hypothetical protein [Candidatus Hecatella orcuttiae]
MALEIGFGEGAVFLLAFLYMLFLPGYNLLRSTGRLKKLELEEKILLSFSLSVVMVGLTALILSRVEAWGLTVQNLLIAVTAVLVATTKEFLNFLRKPFS